MNLKRFEFARDSTRLAVRLGEAKEQTILIGRHSLAKANQESAVPFRSRRVRYKVGEPSRRHSEIKRADWSRLGPISARLIPPFLLNKYGSSIEKKTFGK